jgi:putative membrane protein
MGGTVAFRLHKAQTTFHRQSIPVRLLVWVVVLGVYAAIAACKELIEPLRDFADLPSDAYALLGVILSLLLVFRTNTAYDRWWEGRKLWGQLLNDSRSLIAKVKHLVSTDEQERRDFAELVISFAYALRDHLRGPVELRQLPGFADASINPRHVPGHLIGLMYERLGRWKGQGQLDGMEALLLDRHAAAFSDILGGCERIRNTPLSISYRGYVRLCLLIYLATLPWGLEHTFNWWTIPATMMVAFFMLGLEMIARDVEEPFGLDRDDLPLDALCAVNELNLREILRQPSGLEKHPAPGNDVQAPVS